MLFRSLLSTVGGQTGLNLSVELAESGVLEKYGVELIGAKLPAIRKAEDRGLFREAAARCGLETPQSKVVHHLDEAKAFGAALQYNAIIRPAFTLGGSGAGVSFNREEYDGVVKWGLEASPVTEVLVEQSVLGWKEYELEVMRDLNDNVVIICSIENFDAMGVHTGDSITVAPAQTLTDKEYQAMRDAAIAIIREIGVATGGSNIQFAVNPDNGRMVVIEMNPRVSRSSALASKATGFPIAKMAAKLAVGYTLDEIPNDITKKTPACFEPTIDYCVVKIPRFNFEKFPGAEPTLTTSMKSVGEAMAIGRTFKEALQKGLRSLEIDVHGLDDLPDTVPEEDLAERLRTPTPERIFYIKHALKTGLSVDDVFELTWVDRWFLENIVEIIELEDEIRSYKGKDLADMPAAFLRTIKQAGFSDPQIAELTGVPAADVYVLRKERGIVPTFKCVDTCGAEFEAVTPYYYSTYEDEDEASIRVGS